MFDKTKTFVTRYGVEIVSIAAPIIVTALIVRSNINLTNQVKSLTNYGQAATRALSAVDEIARNSGASVEDLNRVIQAAGLVVKEAV